MGTDHEGLNQPITDPLTGAYSRALLPPRLAEELGRAARGDTGCALFLFDVDHFKSVNDSYGHARGDDILCELVQRVNALIRTYDALFRYGGDEFVLLLPDTAKVDAVKVALRLVDGVRSVPFPGDPALTVSVSLGVATFPDDAVDPEGLLAVADRRNYLAKGRGRACAVADDVQSESKAVSSRLLERDTPLASVQEFLTRLFVEPHGLLRVTGDRGAGHTRFMAEVGKLGKLRGFHVVALADGADAPPPPPPDMPVLVTADRGTTARAGRLAADLLAREPAPPRLGVVYTQDGWADPGLGVDLPLVDTVELLPWSSAALRIWLRTVLQGEPSPVLVAWIAQRSAGLPARAEQAIDRLTAREALPRTESGAYTVPPALLQTSTTRRRRLPQPVTELVGRQQETAQIAQLLAATRLVTLTGPGGIGKTRLSLAVAAAVADGFPDGAVFVAVAEATTTALVVAAIAGALGVAEMPGQPLLDTVGDTIGEQSVLLVVDNFEQVVSAAPVLSTLLAAAPQLRILVSSRERLALYGEQVYPVPPLPVPDLGALPQGVDAVSAALAQSPALALFHARARAANYGFTLTPAELATTAQLCRRLDGLPLAIELAAAHCDTLTPAQLLTQLSERLDIGDGPQDLPGRQQTLRQAIEWSVELLDPADLRLFTSLGAFSGGCFPDAVAALDTPPRDTADPLKRLDALCDKSLLQVATAGPAEGSPTDDAAPAERRYQMLETIRAYAAGLLDGDAERERIRADHAAHYVAFAAACAGHLTGPDQTRWVTRIERDHQNLRAAFELLMDRGDGVAASTIVLGLWRFWRNGNHIGEGRDWLRRVVDRGDRLDGAVLGKVLHASAILAAAQDDNHTAGELARQSLARAVEAGDAAGVAHAHNALGIALLGAGDYPSAREHFLHCLRAWTGLDQRIGMAMAYGNLTKVALRVGDVDEAAGYAGRCLEIEQAVGNTRGIQLGQACMGEILLARHDLPEARRALGESLSLSRSLGDVFGEAMALFQLGRAARMDGDDPEAIRLTVQALSLRHGVGDREDLATSLDTIAVLAAPREPELAARLLGAADAIRAQHRLPVPAAIAEDRDRARQQLLDLIGEHRLTTTIATGRLTALDLLVDEAESFAENCS
jgi:diguanylate cyclase (GGDEF)-like protein